MKMQTRSFCALALLLVASTAAQAQTLTASNTSGGSNTLNQPSTVTYAPGPDSGAFDFTLTYDITRLTTTTAEVTGTVPNGSLNCNVPGAGGTILCNATANQSTVDLGAATITILFDLGATIGTTPLTFTGSSCTNQLGAPEPNPTCAPVNGSVNIQAISSPTIAYTPAPGPITFPAGAAGSTSTQNVTADGTGGTAGESTVTTCGVTGTGFSLGTVTPSNPFTVNNGDPVDTDATIPVICTYAAGTPRTGTLTCTANPSQGADVVSTWALSCPAGGAQPPTAVFNPASPGPVVYSGTLGQVVNGPIAVTQGQTGAAGTSLTINGCAITGPGAAAFGTPTTTPSPILFTGGTAGQTGTINTSCTIPAATQNATLTCNQTSNDGTGAGPAIPITWNLICQGPAPEFNSTPPSGSTVSLTGAPSTTLQGSIGVQNTGSAPLNVTACSITGADAANFVQPTAPGPIAPGGAGAITFACTAPAAAGTTFNASLSCTTDDADEGTVTWPLACSSLILSIPTMGLAGKGLMALLVLSLGLIGFGLHRRMS